MPAKLPPPLYSNAGNDTLLSNNPNVRGADTVAEIYLILADEVADVEEDIVCRDAIT